MQNFGYTPSNDKFGSVIVNDFIANSNLVGKANSNNLNQYIIPAAGVFTKSQGSLSACGAFSTTTALEILAFNSTGKYTELSPIFTYYNARLSDNSIGMDAGSYISHNFESLRILGVCSHKMWKTDPKQIYNTPGILAYKEANDNKVENFKRISSSGQDRLDEIEICLRNNLPVVFGTAVSRDFQNYNGNDVVFNAPSKNDIIGMHAMAIIGVRKNDNGRREWCLRNSWSTFWGFQIDGNGGHAWINSDYLLDKNSSDFFVASIFNGLI